MKHVVSVSLGSSERDHRVEIELLGESFIIERIGTDGSMEGYLQKIRELDGKIDAFGMGGVDRYLYTRNRRYSFRDVERLAVAAVKTPIVDGSGLKSTLERRVIQYLDQQLGMVRGKRVLMVSGIDRFGMSDAFEAAGAIVTYGDLAFALGLPLPIRSQKGLDLLGDLFLPVLTLLPIKWVYPTGSKQRDIEPKYGSFYSEADIVAGDFLYIRKYMPADMKGKVVVTNTVTAKNVEELRERGVATLVTTTPELSGRSFGTNVMEATLIALSGKKPEEMHENDYNELLDKLQFAPRVQQL